MKEYEHLLSVQDLHTTFTTDNGEVHAVNGVSFDIYPGETYGLVGETGCGKTHLLKAIYNQVILEHAKVLYIWAT